LLRRYKNTSKGFLFLIYYSTAADKLFSLFSFSLDGKRNLPTGRQAKRSRKNEWLRPFFQPTHKEPDNLKVSFIFEVTGPGLRFVLYEAPKGAAFSPGCC
jgi:hypothetical protein